MSARRPALRLNDPGPPPSPDHRTMGPTSPAICRHWQTKRVAGQSRNRPALFPSLERLAAKENWPVPEGPAKFEQGGFTSRRRKGPKTLFPGASPGNSFGATAPQKLIAMQYRAKRNIVV